MTKATKDSKATINKIQPNGDWRERFKNTRFAKGGGLSFECSDFEGMYSDLLDYFQSELDRQREEIIARLPEEEEMSALDQDEHSSMWKIGWNKYREEAIKRIRLSDKLKGE